MVWRAPVSQYCPQKFTKKYLNIFEVPKCPEYPLCPRADPKNYPKNYINLFEVRKCPGEPLHHRTAPKKSKNNI